MKIYLQNENVLGLHLHLKDLGVGGENVPVSLSPESVPDEAGEQGRVIPGSLCLSDSSGMRLLGHWAPGGTGERTSPQDSCQRVGLMFPCLTLPAPLPTLHPCHLE